VWEAYDEFKNYKKVVYDAQSCCGVDAGPGVEMYTAHLKYTVYCTCRRDCDNV